MLNPSTADASKDDPTIRKCVGFSSQWGCGRIVVVNLYAFRTKSPKVLYKARVAGTNVVGPKNLSYVAGQLDDVNLAHVVCAWGANADPSDSSTMIEFMQDQLQSAPQCLGFTKDGYPKHPLTLAYKTPLEPVLVKT